MSTSINCVLYVDDDELSLLVMNLLLVEQMGLPSLITFSNSADFLEHVEALPRKPDLILLDIHVKPLSGFEMLKLLRKNRFADTLIIALTASVMSEEVTHLKAAGFDGVIAKPINLETFPDLWEQLLSGEAVWTVA